MKLICFIFGHKCSEMYSDGDHVYGESPTFHCLRCGEREPFHDGLRTLFADIVRFFKKEK